MVACHLRGRRVGEAEGQVERLARWMKDDSMVVGALSVAKVCRSNFERVHLDPWIPALRWQQPVARDRYPAVGVPDGRPKCHCPLASVQERQSQWHHAGEKHVLSPPSTALERAVVLRIPVRAYQPTAEPGVVAETCEGEMVKVGPVQGSYAIEPASSRVDPDERDPSLSGGTSLDCLEEY